MNSCVQVNKTCQLGATLDHNSEAIPHIPSPSHDGGRKWDQWRVCVCVCAHGVCVCVHMVCVCALL